MSAIDNLRTAVEAAAGDTAFVLDSSFLTKGLNDPSVTVPADYDTWIQQAFFAASVQDFTVKVAKSDVGEVKDNAFTVTNATIPFIGASAPLASIATLVFTLNDTTLVVQIQTTPSQWTWTDSFAFMGRFPFNQFNVLNDLGFVFSTASGKYPFGDKNGQDVSGGAVQNFSAKVPLPDVAKPFLVLFDGLTAPTGDLLLTGGFNMGVFNGETVLFPPGTLKAAIQDGSFKLLYLTVSDPSIAITIPEPDSADGDGNGNALIVVADDETNAGDQAPTLAIASGINVSQDSGPAPYTLNVEITPGDDGSYDIALTATGEGTPLTPSSVIELVGGGGSYFAATPDVLQQFLAFVTLNGFTIAGDLGSTPTIASASVDIGSSENTSWTILPDPTGALDFTITSFSLQWAIQNPFDNQTRQQTYTFDTQFTLATAVFKGPDGEGDGLFEVQFTSDKMFFASFDGTAKLSDFLSTLSGGVINLDVDDIGDFELSDIALNVDYGQQSFKFSSGFSLELNLLQINNEPILAVKEGTISVAAKTPTQKKDGGNATTLLRPSPVPDTSRALALVSQAQNETQWQSSIGGFLQVGPLHANVSVTYDGFDSPKRWKLSSSLTEQLAVSQLINQFFDPGGSYPFPDFLPGDLVVSAFDVNAVIPAETGELKTSYDITTEFKWTFTFGDQTVGIDPAKLGVNYDGGQPSGQQFSGFAQGTWIYTAINLQLIMGYEFKPTKDGGNNILFVEWEGFRAEWSSGKELITFSLKGWSIGTLIQALVRTLGNPYFTLTSPWDLLNQISLDGLRINVSLKSGQSFSQRLSATYELSSPINLGFISITGLTFRRDTDGKVTLAIEGSSPLVSQDPAFDNLLDPAKGQDVQDLPPVPGRGEQWFKLFLLVLGQRIGITGYSTFNNTKEVICALQNVPQTTGKTNPVDPNANQGSTNGLPYYDQSNNWLIAGHLGIMKVGDAWSIDAMVVFNDPNLYGLRLALAGSKVGGLANLVIDILYKKITDDIGVYQIEFTFPDVIRNLNFGAVSIVLPQIGIKVYTNGDFFIDIGFPYNLDFSRSFSISVIVYGVPILGSGGFYFGKLSNATSTQVPKTDLGTFDPVIEFGVGLQLGLGYNFVKGPLKAGFALTVFGIIEGVVAPWHPYDTTGTDIVRANSGGALQSDYFFKVSGTVGIIGLLYGSVDFAIISAAVNVKITLSLNITYEAFREIPITATASVVISLKVKINLGLFSISIKLSFSATVSASFIVGSNQPAPWEADNALLADARFATPPMLRGPDAAMRLARTIQPRPKRLVRDSLCNMGLAATAEEPPTLSLLAGAQYTVLAPEGATSAPQNEGAFVFLLAMDAPDSGDSTPSPTSTSFDILAQAYFPWIIDTLANEQGDTVDLAQVMATSVTLAQLEAFVTRLADNENKVLTITQLLQFLADSFKLNIENPATADTSGLKEKLQAGSVLFPVFDGLSLSTPNASGSGDPSAIDFETYATATPSYASTITDLFNEIAAQIDAQNQEQPIALAALDDTPESLAALVFIDSFALIGRQLLQAAVDALKGYAYPLTTTTSITSIRTDLNGISGNAITIADVATPNVNHSLTANLALTIADLTYTTQASDTIQTVATRYSDTGSPARWTTTPAGVIVANQTQHMLQGNISLTLTNSDGQPQTYVTRQGDSFNDIADALGPITIDALAAQSVLYTVEGLLTPTLPMVIPSIAYTTAGDSGASTDTLASLAQTFQTTATAIATTNADVSNLFSTDAENGLITVANLQALSVSSLWDAIAATGQVGQTAGMVSRFLVYGLRLPVETGLTLSDAFLYPTSQTAYGVYQLTGQQFPVPANADTYSITVDRAATSHGVALDFVTFNSGTGTSMGVDLTQAYSDLEIVVTWAQTPGNFEPSPTFTALPLADRQAKAFTTGGFALWSSAAMTDLVALTNRSGTQVADDSTSAQGQPTLWALPPAQTNLVAARETTIQTVVSGAANVFPLLPQFQPQVGRTNPSTGQTAYTDLENWAWCTRIDVQIKRLPDGTAVAQQGQGAGDVPTGPASTPPLPFVYELIGPNSEDAVQLERILTAMDSLGEGIASAVFLLYNQSGPGAPMLVTPADTDFLAFITQTNLSTETNPAVALRALALAEGQPPRGIANTPAQFIRLLWELSTVRSGGYYLYYENVETGQDLPASVFDSAGTGTLTMVVTFAPSGSLSFGNTTPNFVTSFITTDAIDTQSDTVQTVSLSATGPTAATTASDSLASLSATYGPGPGRIAETNSGVALTTGVEIPIKGATRQLTNADLVRTNGTIDPTQTLANLATLFSAGAVTPISGTDIATYNAGVTVALAAVFYIPDVTYKVDPSAAPGATFTSMSTYYGLSVDLLARGAVDVAGIFPTGTVLQLNSEIFDLRDQLPPQNVGIGLSRQNFGEPPESTDPNFAKYTMYELYTSLAAGLTQNVFYSASKLGLPFGPQDFPDTETPESFQSHAQMADARSTRLAAVAEADYDYRQSVGITSQFALVNAAPDPAQAGLPAKADNPYLGVGTTAQITLEWRDVFGNTTVTPFNAPSDTYSGALNGSAVPLLYRDRLIGLGSWSNTNASYIYDNTNGTVLNLTFALNAAAYQGDNAQAQAANDLTLYTQLYFQLNQDYTNNADVAVPGISGNAVSMMVSNSLMADADTVLDGTQADVIRGYVSDCVVYLNAIASGQTGTAPSASLSLPIDVSAIASGNIIEMDVALVLARNPLLVEPSVAALQNGLSVSALVLPKADTDAGVAFTKFSTALETIFQTNDWYLKVGEGLSRTGADAADGDQQLWAVRFGKATGQGIYFDLGTTPSYYAPKPVAKALQSGQVTITEYTTGQQQTLNVDGADLNQWFQAALDGIDQFLSADFAPHAFILDKINGVNDPLTEGKLGEVLNTKASLADTISSTVLPVLSTSATDASTQAFAAEKLRQQLLNQLGAAYRAGAVTVFGLSNVTGATGSNPAGPPNLYGQPTGTIDGQPLNQNFSLTPARIPLGPTERQSTTYDPRLPFVFTSKNLIEQAYVPLTLGLDISHLEFDLQTVPGITGYIDSRWLAFVNGPFNYTLGDGVSNIPVVNRNLPTPPTVSGQTAVQLSDTSPTNPSDLNKWTYTFSYLYQQAASDAISYTIEFNRPPSQTAALALADGPDLFTALTEFTTNYPAILQDLNQYLVKINGTDPDAATLAGAQKAVDAFATETANIATAYAASLQLQALALAAAPEQVIVKFLSTLDGTTQGYARTNILNITINGVDATYDAAAKTISADTPTGTITLPAMVIEIEPTTYTAEPVPVAQLPHGVQIAYLYSHTVDGQKEYLTSTAAFGIAARDVKMTPLDVLALQSGWASVFVQRNLALFPIGDIDSISTNEAFLFQTPEVRAANAIVPRLVYTSFDLDTMPNATGDLDALLTLFFKDLYSEGTGATSADVSMQGLYSYQLVSGDTSIPRVNLPINLLTPSPSVVSPTIKPAFVTPFTTVINDWQTTNKPTTGGAASIDIELKVFGATENAKQPLITVQGLTHAVEGGD